jgi:2-oxoglutarate ferredoxin oxidoreductase subunit alpha
VTVNRTAPDPPLAPVRQLVDGSRLIVEALARSGADTYVGYPITPANLMYSYSFQRFPAAVSAPDEITALQWMAGFSACGRLPVTATSFPGFALMVESLNMAHMMELPMVIVLAQRLGPATGSATVGASGDLLLLAGVISGGNSLPVFCPTDLSDCWELAALALRTAVRLRSPVVILTSKEMVMTQRDFDVARLPALEPVRRGPIPEGPDWRSYAPGEDLVPGFLPVGNNHHQVRLTASTHDQRGLHQSLAPEAIANTRRLHDKSVFNLPDYLRYELDEQPGAETIIVAWDVTAQAARHAVKALRGRNQLVSLLLPKTLLPLAPLMIEVLDRYRRVVIAEENLTGQLAQLLYGAAGRPGLRKVNAIGRLIAPPDIVAAVTSND